jgi:RNA polymerase sigma factor (sigma-70 family)
MIPSTHLSLLEALKDPDQRHAAWERLQRRYEETIYRWCVKHSLQPATAEVVTQTILVRLYERLPEHRHNPSHRFRSWLKAVVRNAICDWYRQLPPDHPVGGSTFQDRLANLEAPEPDELNELAEAIELADPKLAAAVEYVKARVKPHTWQAFWRVQVDGLSYEEAAAELGLTLGQVYQANYRVKEMLATHYSNPEK